MEAILSTYFFIAILVVIYMSAVFVASLIFTRNDIADVAWGLGFILVTLASLLYNGTFGPRQAIIVVLVTLWGLRLATHIFLRNRGKSEDFRYKKWRQDWGKQWVVKSYLQVFLLQGFLLTLIAMPIITLTAIQGPSLRITDLLGVAVWLVGFFFETVGDWQLFLFKKNPNNKGKIMTAGLWQYTRHPNYFGEVTMWWGIFILALSSPWGMLSIIGPLTISYLILKVSGIPILEKKYEGVTAFQEYKRTTSAFIPWFPKRKIETNP